MKPLLGAALLAAVVLAASACGSSHPTGSPQATGTTVSSSRLILGGAVRCTATLTSPVQAGHELGVSVSFHNVSDRTVKVQPAYGGVWVLVKSPDGMTYDTRIPWEDASVLPPGPIPLRPGATATRHLLPGLHVRWDGSLRVTPGCDLSAAPPVRVAVTSPGPPASDTAAMNDVVAATGHLLDHCRPSKPGIAVVGRIDPPSGSTPPLQARCSISLRREGDFSVAQVLVLTPPDLRGVSVDPTYEALTGTNVANRNTQAIAWQFVVTRDGATSVDSADSWTTRHGGGMAPAGRWSSARWQRAGDVRCGGGGGGSSGANGPGFAFVSVC
jgi:hypothetical protein